MSASGSISAVRSYAEHVGQGAENRPHSRTSPCRRSARTGSQQTVVKLILPCLLSLLSYCQPRLSCASHRGRFSLPSAWMEAHHDGWDYTGEGGRGWASQPWASLGTRAAPRALDLLDDPPVDPIAAASSFRTAMDNFSMLTQSRALKATKQQPAAPSFLALRVTVDQRH
jgi:hypothetical protein